MKEDMSKFEGKKARTPNPFDISSHATERTKVAVLMHWMRNIIEQKGLSIGMPDVETAGTDKKMPDTVIWESPRSQNIMCVIEAKPPYFDVFNFADLKEPAWKKAVQRKAKYFAVTNFKTLVWYKTEAVNAMKPEEEQIAGAFELSRIEDLDQIEESQFSLPTKSGLELFLTKLDAVFNGREPEPKQAIDELLIFRIHQKISVLSNHYRRIIYEQCQRDSTFARSLQQWFVDQGWNFTWHRDDFVKAARQTAYLLINKILFYNLLQAKRPNDLDQLVIPGGLTKGSQLKKILQSFFDEVLKIDYETIYSTDFIDSIAFPDEKEVVKEVLEFVDVLKTRDFSKLGFDVIGRIFERLIPQQERHNLGQYFTNPDVVDLILTFCSDHEDDKILDPSCGAGTFLVRAYQQKKIFNIRKKHEEILGLLWGTDIAKFPAHLATINLAINDLGVRKNYPYVIQRDFFSIMSNKEGGIEIPDDWRRARARTLGVDKREVIIPRYFDAIVGNPPYTRQEEIPQIGVDKEELIFAALSDSTGNRMASITKRAGVHAYFFVHGTKFLKDGGHFGFVVSNSWLDTDYGKGLQEFFLKYYRIVAIIESKVERWFEDAAIRTCIVVLEKCRDKKKRDANLVKFVYLKKPLRHFIPPAQDIWEKQVERAKALTDLRKVMMAHDDFYENEELHIYPKIQSELWEEGFDEAANEFVGAKWGKYLRAPEIFFTILKRNRDKLVPLKQAARVKFGIKTGANEFFYLTEEEIAREQIEKQFWTHRNKKGTRVPNYVVLSPKECGGLEISADNLSQRVLMIHGDKSKLKKTHVLKFIERGEAKGFNQRATCASREKWYDLGERTPYGFLHPMIHNERQVVALNLHGYFVDHNLFEIQPKRKDWLLPLAAYFVSTPAFLMKELGGRVNLGEGALKTEGVDIEKFLSIDPNNLGKRPLEKLRKWVKNNLDYIHESCFEEFGARTPEEISLDRIKPARRDLDKIVMGEILGLSDDEQIEVYRAVLDLVKSRLEIAKSVQKKRITPEGMDVDQLKKSVVERIEKESE